MVPKPVFQDGLGIQISCIKVSTVRSMYRIFTCPLNYPNLGTYTKGPKKSSLTESTLNKSLGRSQQMSSDQLTLAINRGLYSTQVI